MVIYFTTIEEQLYNSLEEPNYFTNLPNRYKYSEQSELLWSFCRCNTSSLIFTIDPLCPHIFFLEFGSSTWRNKTQFCLYDYTTTQLEIIGDIYNPETWWRHQMETFSKLLALCAGNSPVTGEFPTERPVTRSFHYFFICAWMNGWVNNREACDLRSNSAHYDVTVMASVIRHLDPVSI